MSNRHRIAALFCVAACGRSGSTEPSRPRDAGVADATVAPIHELAPLVLGMATREAFAYRERAGHALYKRAREAEHRGDWTATAAACEAALAADPLHLEASYLLAIARAKSGQRDAVAAPLVTAIAGDYAKWGQAALEQPALQEFFSTAIGREVRERVEAERVTFVAALARSLLVTYDGEVYAYDDRGPRWYRLTRTAGAVIGSLYVESAARIAYVIRERVTVDGKTKRRYGIGIVDLAQGRSRSPLELDTGAPIRVAYHKKRMQFVVRVANVWLALDDTAALRTVPTLPAEHAGATTSFAGLTWLDVERRIAKLSRLSLDKVSADWDKATLASAIRFGSSKRVVSVPSPGLIDGNTAVWSPDHRSLAFVAQLRDDCKPDEPRSAAFVADAATGQLQELERATKGMAIDWLADGRIALAGDKGVSIVTVGGEAKPLVGADGLVWPRTRHRCTPEPVDDGVAPDE